MSKNRHIYKRDGADLTYKGTALAPDAVTAVQRGAATIPLPYGKYVVTDLDFTTIEKVDLRPEAVKA